MGAITGEMLAWQKPDAGGGADVYTMVGMSQTSTLALSQTQYDLHMSDDGTQLYCQVRFGATSYTNQYALSTPFSLASATYLERAVYSGEEATGVCLSSDGVYVYIGKDQSNVISRYTLTTPYDIVPFGSELQQARVATVPTLAISPDGTVLLIMSTTNLYTWTMSTPYLLSSRTETSKTTTELGYAAQAGRSVKTARTCT